MERKSSVSTLSYRVALGGIIAALCLVCMFLTGVIPMLYLILPMVASALIYIMAIETTPKWGLLTYFTVGILSLIITPNKDAGLVFLLFFGYYPLLRVVMKRVHMGFLFFLLRLLIFNAAVMIFFWGSVYLLGATELLDSLGTYGKYGGEIMLVMANVMFLCYDYIMTLFPLAYQKQLKSRISPTRPPKTV